MNLNFKYDTETETLVNVHPITQVYRSPMRYVLSVRYTLSGNISGYNIYEYNPMAGTVKEVK